MTPIPRPRRRAQPVFTSRQVPPAGGDDMQAEPPVCQNFVCASTVKIAQAFAKQFAHGFGCRPGLARSQFVVLPDVVVLQALECGERIVQTRRCHAPGTYRRADQMQFARARRQSLAKQKTVERYQNQAFGPSGSPGDGADIGGGKAGSGSRPQRLLAGVPA